MGNHSQLSARAATGAISNRPGVALPASLFGLVAVSIMAAGIYSMTDLQSKSVKNRVSSARAMMLAEAGMVHAVTVLADSLKKVDSKELFLGYDTEEGTADDGLIVGYGLSAGAQIPAAGKNVAAGNYKVTITDDPGDTDGNPLTDDNFRFLLNCTGETVDGGKATLSAVIGYAMYPGVVTEGDLKISGNPTVVGKCGGVHANAVLTTSGATVVTNYLSASGEVNQSGTIEDPEGATIDPRENQPPMEVPELVPTDYCAGADYTLYANGTILRKGDPLPLPMGGGLFGWKRTKGPSDSWVEFEQTGAKVDGTVCAHGSVKIPGTPGTAANPWNTSIIATGSIQVSGNPTMRPLHDEGILLLAGADVEINGNPGTEGYEGLIYSTSQCKVNGAPTVFGQLVCKNKPNPAKTAPLTNLNEISGDPIITYDCGGFKLTKRRVLFWYQTGT